MIGAGHFVSEVSNGPHFDGEGETTCANIRFESWLPIRSVVLARFPSGSSLNRATQRVWGLDSGAG
jgi:hypothetical protein